VREHKEEISFDKTTGETKTMLNGTYQACFMWLDTNWISLLSETKTDYCSLFPDIFYEKILSQWDCCMASLVTI
jgi:hypothetical protein